MFFSDANDVKVAVVPQYKNESSSRHDSHWSYSVFIENNSECIIQLVSKHWRITYADGTSHEVLKNATLDEKLIIKPGTILESKNTTNFKTTSAIIEGHYVMTSKGNEFEVKIPTFSLDTPYQTMSIN
jgi:ApaG protein